MTSPPEQASFSLKGRVTVVTGGGRGIGLTLVKAAAGAGSHVAILDVLPQPVDDVEVVGRENGVTIRYYKTDVTNETQLQESFAALIADFGRIDACVTAAGIAIDKAFEEHGWDESKRVFDVNVHGTIFAVQHALKQMELQGTGGSIVMIASLSATTVVPAQRLSVYAASKAAVRTFAQHLAVEVAHHKIRVNTISPGVIRTDMTKVLGDRYPYLLDMFEKEAPLQRMGEQRDLAPALLYLLSDASSYTTGLDMLITGGLHLGSSKTLYQPW